MWAQMIKTRIKAGQEGALQQLPEEMQAQTQRMGPGHGPLRTIVFQDENNPDTYITVIFFESEAKAREFERSPEQHEIQQRMMEVWDGPPEFTDMNVIYEMNR